SLEPRLALFHKGLPAFAKILAVHARDADIPDRLHVALARVLQDLCDGDLRRLDSQRRVTGNRARDLHGRIPQFTVWQDTVDQADAQSFDGIDPRPRVQEKPRPGRADQRNQVLEPIIAIGNAELGSGNAELAVRSSDPDVRQHRHQHAAAEAKTPDAGN